MKPISFIYTVLCLLSFSLTAAESRFKIERITTGDLKQERELFQKSFTAAYEPIKSQLGVTDLQSFLAGAFEDEFQDFSKHTRNAHFFRMLLNDKLVGFVSFNLETDNSVYIRQLAVDPDHQKQGVGKKLVLFGKTLSKNVKRLYLVTRRVNIGALRFYEKIGFTESSDTHEGLDPKKYVGYEQKFVQTPLRSAAAKR